MFAIGSWLSGLSFCLRCCSASHVGAELQEYLKRSKKSAFLRSTMGISLVRSRVLRCIEWLVYVVWWETFDGGVCEGNG